MPVIRPRLPAPLSVLPMPMARDVAAAAGRLHTPLTDHATVAERATGSNALQTRIDRQVLGVGAIKRKPAFVGRNESIMPLRNHCGEASDVVVDRSDEIDGARPSQRRRAQDEQRRCRAE